MFCRLCSKAFPQGRKFVITQHVNTVSHELAERRRAAPFPRKSQSPAAATSRYEQVRTTSMQSESSVWQQIRDKYAARFRKNIGFRELRRVQDFMQGNVRDDFPSMSVRDIPSYKFAPFVSYEVERSFHRYKAISREDRQLFQFEHLKTYVIAACNHHLLQNQDGHYSAHFDLFFMHTACCPAAVPPWSDAARSRERRGRRPSGVVDKLIAKELIPVSITSAGVCPTHWSGGAGRSSLLKSSRGCLLRTFGIGMEF